MLPPPTPPATPGRDSSCCPRMHRSSRARRAASLLAADSARSRSRILDRGRSGMRDRLRAESAARSEAARRALELLCIRGQQLESRPGVAGGVGGGSMRRTWVVTGAGLLSAGGDTLEALEASLLAGKPLSRIDPETSVASAPIEGFDPKRY